jgi:hypothetical protein
MHRCDPINSLGDRQLNIYHAVAPKNWLSEKDGDTT